MKCGDRVKVVKIEQDKVMNLWGGYDDTKIFLNETATINSILSDSHYEFGLEFDNEWIQLTRVRTGLLFSKEQLELIS